MGLIDSLSRSLVKTAKNQGMFFVIITKFFDIHDCTENITSMYKYIHFKQSSVTLFDKIPAKQHFWPAQEPGILAVLSTLSP